MAGTGGLALGVVVVVVVVVGRWPSQLMVKLAVNRKARQRTVEDAKPQSGAKSEMVKGSQARRTAGLVQPLLRRKGRDAGLRVTKGVVVLAVVRMFDQIENIDSCVEAPTMLNFRLTACA